MVGMVHIVVLNMSSMDRPLRILIVVHIVRFLPSFRIWSCGSMLRLSVPVAVVLVWSSVNIVAMGMLRSGKVVQIFVVVRDRCCTKGEVDQHKLSFRFDRVSRGLSVVAIVPVRYPY